MDRFWESNAVAGIPAFPVGSVGHPTDGNLALSIPPTTPGAWWYHMVTEELRAVVVAGGLVPNGSVLNQLVAALDARYSTAGSGVTSVNGLTGAVTVPTGLARNAIGYVVFVAKPGGPPLGNEGDVITISGRPGTWLVSGWVSAAADEWNTAIRIA
jgi:hypothetical protein